MHAGRTADNNCWDAPAGIRVDAVGMTPQPVSAAGCSAAGLPVFPYLQKWSVAMHVHSFKRGCLQQTSFRFFVCKFMWPWLLNWHHRECAAAVHTKPHYQNVRWISSQQYLSFLQVIHLYASSSAASNMFSYLLPPSPPEASSSVVHYRHLLFGKDGSITPLVAASDLPVSLVSVLPPTDMGSIVGLQEILMPVERITKALPSRSITTSVTNAAETPAKRSAGRQPLRPRSCVYFLRRQGCKRGDKCRYIHDIKPSTPLPLRTGSPASAIRCLEEKWHRASHVESKPKAPQPPPKHRNIFLEWSKKEPSFSSSKTVSSIAGDDATGSTECTAFSRMPSPTDPQKAAKTHCTFFLRFGECGEYPISLCFWKRVF